MFNYSLRKLGLALGILGLAGMASAQVIVSTAYVQDALKRNVQVWDVRADKDYAKAHLTGALTIGDAATALRDANAEDFLKPDDVAKVLGAAGIDPAKETIVYGTRGTWNPYFGRYALRYFGGSKVSVYHDGLEAWQAAGLPVETGAAKATTPIKLTLKANPSLAYPRYGRSMRPH